MVGLKYTATQSISTIFLLTTLSACGVGVGGSQEGSSPAKEVDESISQGVAAEIEFQAANLAAETPLEQTVDESVVEPVNANIGAAEDYGPFNDYVAQAMAAYSGKDSESDLSLDAASQFLTHSLLGIPKPVGELDPNSTESLSWLAFSWSDFFQLPQLSIDGRRFDMPYPGSRPCSQQVDQGALDVKFNEFEPVGLYSKLQYDIEYSDCIRSTNSIIDGHVLVEYDRHNYSLVNSSLYMAFDNVIYKSSESQFEVNGVIKWAAPSECELPGAKTYFINIKNLKTGKSVFLENYSTALSGAQYNRCERAVYNPNYASGRILNSDFGVITVSTPEPLQLSLPEREDGQWPSFGNNAGAIKLAANDSSAEFSLETYNPQNNNYSSFNYIKAATLSITSDLYPDTLVFSQNAEVFLKGGLLDMHDSDGDGMINSWEAITGLNPDDPLDASSDSDDDKRTALFEYENFGIPDNALAFGDTFDRRVELNAENSIGKSLSVYVTLHSGIRDTNYADAPHYVGLSASVAGEWDFGNGDCSVSVVDNSLSCHRNANNRYPVSIHFKPIEDGSITFVGSTGIPVKDFDASNNESMVTVEYLRKVNDLEITATDKKYSAVGEAGVFEAHIKQTVGLQKLNSKVTITYPPEIRITNAQRTLHHPNYLNRCEIGDVVVCPLDYFRPDDTVSVRLQYVAEEPGDYRFQWSIEPDNFEEVFDNNDAATQLRVFDNTEGLQELVDNASPGDTVTLPGGHFMGELYLREKQLTLQGAQGEVPTTFYTRNNGAISIRNIGDHTIIRNIHFVSRGIAINYRTGDYLTVEDSVFEPLPDYIHYSNEATRTAAIVGASLGSVGRDVSLRFINNHVSGYGTTGKGGCHAIMYTLMFRSISIEGNTFHDIDCEYGMFPGGQHWWGTDLVAETTYIGNNTFHNTGTLIDHEFDQPYYQHTTRIENNIFTTVPTFFTEDSLASYQDSGNTVVTSNNMIFGSERSSVLIEGLIADGAWIEETPDLSGDPLYADADNNDYSLSPVSPAIDAGVFPTNSTVGFNYVRTIEYADGLQLGKFLPDIGAFEYR